MSDNMTMAGVEPRDPMAEFRRDPLAEWLLDPLSEFRRQRGLPVVPPGWECAPYHPGFYTDEEGRRRIIRFPWSPEAYWACRVNRDVFIVTHRKDELASTEDLDRFYRGDEIVWPQRHLRSEIIPADHEFDDEEVLICRITFAPGVALTCEHCGESSPTVHAEPDGRCWHNDGPHRLCDDCHDAC